MNLKLKTEPKLNALFSLKIRQRFILRVIVGGQFMVAIIFGRGIFDELY